MNVKVECPCGTRFAFDVEPVNQRMPVAINCPGCGADATELANAVIRQQGAVGPRAQVVAHVVAQSAPPAAPAAPAAPPAAAAAPVPPAAPGGIRLARSAPAAAEPVHAAAAPSKQRCARHPLEFAAETCRVCGKPICRKCMDSLGYVCSVYCREQAAHKHIELPVYAGQKLMAESRSNRKTKKIVTAVTAVVAVVLGAWGWYYWFARSPKIVFSQTVDPPHWLDAYRIPDYYRLIGPNQLLIFTNRAVTLLQPDGKKVLWSTPLRTPEEIKVDDALKAKNDHIRATGEKHQNQFGETVQDLTGLDPLEEVHDHIFDNPHAIVTGNEIWMAFAHRIMRLDRQTGSLKEPPAVAGTITSIRPYKEIILVTARNAEGKELFLRIVPSSARIDGDLIPTNQFAAAPKPAPAKTNAPPARTNPAPTMTRSGAPPAATTPAARGATTPAVSRGTTTAQRGARVGTAPNSTPRPTTSVPEIIVRKPVNSDDDSDDSEAISSLASKLGSSFSYGWAGPNVVAGQEVFDFKSKVKEYRTIEREIMKAPPAIAPGKSVLDDKNVTASRGIDLAKEMMQQSAHDLGDVKERQDVSLYEVTLHKYFSKETNEWTGEVIGRPEFTPLTTVDIVSGYSNILVLDKNHKKLWEAKLTFPVVPGYSWADESRSLPCAETKDSLYFADKGVLTRFDLATGNVRWRLPTVGVSDIQADAKGDLYVDTTAAKPKSGGLKFVPDLNMSDDEKLAIMKVSAADGKILWRHALGGVRFHFMPPGKYIFSERLWQAVDPLRLEEGPALQYNFKMHSPSSGRVIWVVLQNRHDPIRTEVVDNWIMLDFEDKIMVMKFWSL